MAVKEEMKLKHVLSSAWSHSTAAPSPARQAAASRQHTQRTWRGWGCQDQHHGAAEM